MAHSEQTPGSGVTLPAGALGSRSARLKMGGAFLALALLIYYGTVLRLDYEKTNFFDLGPYPDAVEYFAQAQSLLKHGDPLIQIGYDRLPSRYPVGYPVLMLPWLSVLTQQPILAPFRTNQTIGLLALLGCFAFYFRLGQPLLGGVAALLLATQPAFIAYSRSSMSDLVGAVAAVLAFALVYLGLHSARRWPIYAAAVVLGLSLSIRAQLLFCAPLLVSMAFFPISPSRGRWLGHCLLVVVVFFLAASPLFIMNTLQFGHPLKTGYDFWVPFFTDKRLPFSADNIPRQASYLWSEMTASWDQFHVAHLFGTGSYVVPAFVLLALSGVFFCRINRFLVSALLGGTTFFLAALAYFYVDGRLYMPVQFLLIALAALSVRWALVGGGRGWHYLPRVAILLLFLLSCAGYPSQSGFPPKGGRSQLWDALHFRSDPLAATAYEATQAFARAGLPPGIVLSNFDPVYLNALLPSGFVAAPIDGEHSYKYSRLWRWGEEEAARLAEKGQASQLPVYALLVDPKNPEDVRPRLPPVKGSVWKEETPLGTTGLVLGLIPRSNSSSSEVTP